MRLGGEDLAGGLTADSDVEERFTLRVGDAEDGRVGTGSRSNGAVRCDCDLGTNESSIRLQEGVAWGRTLDEVSSWSSLPWYCRSRCRKYLNAGRKEQHESKKAVGGSGRQLSLQEACGGTDQRRDVQKETRP